MIDITLPDGSVKNVEANTTSMDIAMSISEGLARNVLASVVNGVVIDAHQPIDVDASLQLLTWRDKGGQSTMWHSSAHLMAEAIQFYYPDVKFAIGPPIAKGFYYDIDFLDESFSENDLAKIESKMKELAKQKNSFERKEVSKTDAIAYFSKTYEFEQNNIEIKNILNQILNHCVTQIISKYLFPNWDQFLYAFGFDFIFFRNKKIYRFHQIHNGFTFEMFFDVISDLIVIDGCSKSINGDIEKL